MAEWDYLDGPDYDVATLKSAESLFGNILTVVIGLIGFVTFVMILIGGFRYLTSAGDAKKTEAAQVTLTQGIMGLVLAVAVYFIIQFIGNFSGATNILNFSIGLP